MRASLRAGSILLGTALYFAAMLSQAAPAYPLKASPDGRYFVDQNGLPFFINGDTPWSLIGQVSNEDAELYIKDATAKGFNTLVVTLVESHYADNAPANYYGVQPYTTRNKLTTPNEEYFAHADWVINKAAEYGIQIILAPNYLGCCSDGYADALANDNTEADARWFGEWVGNRYKNVPNLMYVWGDDLNPGALRSKIQAMAEGVKATDPNHLQSYHAGPENSALDQWSTSEIWLGFNTTYSYEPIQLKVLQDYNRTPYLPFILFETHYENDFGGADAEQIRRQAYTAILSGAKGHQYGNNPIWHMNGKPGDASSSWKNHLDDPGRLEMQYVRTLFESRQWWTLVPDQAHTVVTAGFGSGTDYVAAASTSTNATVMAYLPPGSHLTVDLTRVSGSEAKVWWFNPRKGAAQLEATYPTSGPRSFTPPNGGDWVLVIDDAAANLPAPGTSLTTAAAPLPPTNVRAD